MLSQNFRKAAKAHGEYFPDRNELQVRKGRKIYRFTCVKCELRFSAPGRAEKVFLIAPDATVRELRRAFASLIDSPEQWGAFDANPTSYSTTLQ